MINFVWVSVLCIEKKKKGGRIFFVERDFWFGRFSRPIIICYRTCHTIPSENYFLSMFQTYSLVSQNIYFTWDPYKLSLKAIFITVYIPTNTSLFSYLLSLSIDIYMCVYINYLFICILHLYKVIALPLAFMQGSSYMNWALVMRMYVNNSNCDS